MHFRPISTRDAPAVALLHVEGIRTGFISSLGIDFVTCLYEAIAASENGFGLVAEDDGRIVGFAAFAVHLNKLCRSIILKEGCHFTLLLAGKMFSFKRIRGILETLFYPRRIRSLNLPEAELLSVVVAPERRGSGLAAGLLKSGFEQCRQRGIDKIKVLVGANNDSANRLYLKCGFERVGQINNHGVVSNIYVAGTGQK